MDRAEMEMSDLPFSGSVPGHVVPGSFFSGVALFFLLLAVSRLSRLDSKEEFCALHVPERNGKVLTRVSIVIVVCTIIGLLMETINGAVQWHNTFAAMQHITLYSLFLFSGLVGWMESLGCLPLDSFRGAVTFALLAEALIWHQHSLMKMNPVDQGIHAMASISCLASGVLMGISIRQPNLFAAYIGSLLFLLWHGLWLCTAAINIASKVHWDSEQMVSYFVLEGILLGFITTLVAAFLHRKRPPMIGKGPEYQPVQLNGEVYSEEEEDKRVEEEDVEEENFVNGTPNGNEKRPHVV